MARCTIFLRLPKEDGMLPFNSLKYKSKNSSFSSLPIEEGIFPFKLFSASQIVVTLPFVTVTPYQVDTGFLVSQFVWLYQLGPSVLLYKSTSAKESCTLTCALVVFMFATRANTRQKRIDFVFIKAVFR